MDPASDFELERPQTWNKYSYARNSPLSFTDPTGEVVILASLTIEQQEQLLEGLSQFTGNTYSVDKGGVLQLEATGEDSSPFATQVINELIDSEQEFSVVESPDGANKGLIDTSEIQINFSSFENVDYGRVDPRTFNLGSTFFHELWHASTPLEDLIDGTLRIAYDWTGPVVDIVNRVRAERGLPLRDAYLAEPVGKSRSRLPFINVNPKKPNKRFYVTRQKLRR